MALKHMLSFLLFCISSYHSFLVSAAANINQRSRSDVRIRHTMGRNWVVGDMMATAHASDDLLSVEWRERHAIPADTRRRPNVVFNVGPASQTVYLP